MKNKVFLLVLLAIVWNSCGSRNTREETEQEVLNVQAEPVQEAKYANPVRATGFLGTSKEMKLSFKTGGILMNLPVKEGQKVRRGEVLQSLIFLRSGPRSSRPG